MPGYGVLYTGSATLDACDLTADEVRTQFPEFAYVYDERLMPLETMDEIGTKCRYVEMDK